ncbi:MAG: hypothetical protein VKI81_04525 [Synechococcaceae cyanobacterium]|nr:hypothetical protein [Synechococcaceae cyanobacterium]
MLRRLLLLPVLAPLLAALAVATVNPRPVVALRLLVWRTPPLPLGVWIAAAAAAGAALSGSASALALREARPDLRRRVRRPLEQGWRRERPEPRERPEEAFAPDSPFRAAAPFPAQAFAGPERAPGEPAPTVSVPFRVLRRPAAAAGGAAPAPRAEARAEPAAQTVEAPVPAGDGWEAETLEDW